MKKTIISIFSCIFFLSIAKTAQAHFLATDKNIGAILHVDPNDQPVAGEQASFFFEFKDKQNRLTPQKCDCKFEIDENGTAIYSESLFQNTKKPSLNNASIFYTFPKIDVYTIKVTGKPFSKNAFQSFLLTWNFRVDQQINKQQVLGTQTNFFLEHWIHLLIGTTLFIVFSIYFFRPTHKKNNNRKKGGEKKDQKEDFSNMY